MEFRLLYEGALHASGNKNTRASEKHDIRRSFHPQLRRQWQLNGSLRQLAARRGLEYNPVKFDTEEERFQHGITEIGKHWRRNGYELVPLVTSEHLVRCSIDILLLRPEEERFVLRQGDIDGQIKTLFDALRIPANDGETGGASPQPDEIPLFCLLEDDRLISEVRMNANQLLLLPRARTVTPNDAFAVIHVKVNALYPGAIGNYF